MKRKKDLLYRKNILNKMNKINEFRVCDCFLDSILSFVRKCESIDNIDDMKNDLMMQQQIVLLKKMFIQFLM